MVCQVEAKLLMLWAVAESIWIDCNDASIIGPKYEIQTEHLQFALHVQM